MAKKQKNKTVINPLFSNLTLGHHSIVIGVHKFVEGDAQFYFLGQFDLQKIGKIIEQEALDYQKQAILKKSKELVHFQGRRGPVWIYSPQNKTGPFSHSGRLEESSYAAVRETIGNALAAIKAHNYERLHVELDTTEDSQDQALLTAIAISAYTYKAAMEGKSALGDLKIYVKKSSGKIAKESLQTAMASAHSVNMARHLVNTPPNFLNPETMVDFVKSNFKGKKNLQLEFWDEKKLKSEGMGLHLAVGQGAQHGPCLIHIKYRPKSKSGLKPIAFVGKGITFDTGGYDIKPSSGMRLMKKDMGGAACVLGLAHWAVESHYHRPLDFYLAMAENMVDAKSFRPSDVVTARNGMKVEIHNTDAEGRLVLADALDVAVTQKGADEPMLVVDVATLTGAIKVALGGEIAGLFSNDDTLADEINLAGQVAGDLNWRMPLFSKYTGPMSSAFADIVNAVDGFGGAITAALFLEKFVKNKPWAHLDIYAWNDKPTGPLAFSGGNGQGVQCLIQFLKKHE